MASETQPTFCLRYVYSAPVSICDSGSSHKLICSFLVRVAAFALRAVLAHSVSAGSNESLLTADEVLFGIGFFGLLYSAYTLVLDR